MTTTLQAIEKKKRVKIVHNESMVAHLWGHQLQPHARTPRGNFYFQDEVIYSYGSHFPIARYVPGSRGKQSCCILLTHRTYNSTTSGQVACVKRAIRHGDEVFTVDWVGSSHDLPDHAANFADYKKRLETAVAACLSSTTRGRQYLNEATNLADEGNRYAKRFGIRGRLKISDGVMLDMGASALKSDVRAASREANRDAKYKADQEKRARENAMGREGRVAAWLAGESVCLKDGDFPEIGLRVRGSRIETTQGATVEISECRELLKKLRHALRDYETSHCWSPPDVHFGPVGRWGNAEMVQHGGKLIVRIGCHDITVAEILRIADSLGE